jgi:diacylglycerol kinase (ATP)
MHVANSCRQYPFYGSSIQICPAASPHDGAADVVVIQSRGQFRLLPILFTVYQGKHIRRPAVSFYKGTSVSPRTQIPLLVQANGEFAGSTPLQIEIVPSALTVIGSTLNEGNLHGYFQALTLNNQVSYEASEYNSNSHDRDIR